jgi:hypothetical protein
MLPVNELKFGEETTVHPAFGIVHVTHWTTNQPKRMFGSDLGHLSGVTLEFSTARQYRNLSYDTHMQEDRILIVELSQSQWARLVSESPNVPVTITHRIQGQAAVVPHISAPEKSKKEIFGHEVNMQLQKSLASMKELTETLGSEVHSPSVSKRKLKEIHREFSRLVDQLPGNVQYVFDQFSESAEKIAEDTKIEIESFVSKTLQQLNKHDAGMVKLPA